MKETWDSRLTSLRVSNGTEPGSPLQSAQTCCTAVGVEKMASPPSADPSFSGRRALSEITWWPLWEPGARLKGYASD